MAMSSTGSSLSSMMPLHRHTAAKIEVPTAVGTMLRLIVCLCALCVATQLVRVEGVGAESWRAHHGEDTAPTGPAVSALDASPSQDDEDLGEGKSGPFAQEARVGVAALDADWVAMKNQTIWTRHGPSVTKKTFKAYYLKKYNSLNNNDETAIAVRHCSH